MRGRPRFVQFRNASLHGAIGGANGRGPCVAVRSRRPSAITSWTT